jgi:hypothetical protein
VQAYARHEEWKGLRGFAMEELVVVSVGGQSVEDNPR